MARAISQTDLYPPLAPSSTKEPFLLPTCNKHRFLEMSSSAGPSPLEEIGECVVSIDSPDPKPEKGKRPLDIMIKSSSIVLTIPSLKRTGSGRRRRRPRGAARRIQSDAC